MLRILRAQTNKISLTLQEKQTVDTYFPLFRFVSEKHKEIDNLVQLNANISNSRFDQFTIILPTDLDLKTGQYMYFVYQALTAIDTDFENMVLLERGKALII